MRLRRLIPLAIFALFSALYIRTMCPSIYTMDSGELIVAADKLTIAHPTGYPLFCLLGKLFTYLIPLGSVAWRINAMNALFAAASISVLFVAVNQIARRNVALFAAALFGLSPVMWDVATSADVHALTALLVSVELAVFLRWRKVQHERLLVWLALVMGLSLTNHLSAALILPGLLYGVLQRDRSILKNRSLMTRLVLCFVLPLGLYLYLPIRAAAGRGSIWGDLYAAIGFFGHVTGRVYGNRMFSSPPAQVWGQFVGFLRLAVGQFPIYLAWLIPVGAILIRHRHPRLFGALVIGAGVNVLYAVNYAIPDIEPYYIPTLLMLAVALAAGINFLLEERRPGTVRAFATFGMPAALVVLLISGFQTADKHNASFIMDYADNAMQTMPRNSLFIACGDSTCNALLYARAVEGRRPDLIVVERNILRTWKKGSPEWTARYYYEAASEVSPAMSALRWPNHYTKTQIVDEELLRDVIGAAIKERPVYIGCTGNEEYRHPIVRQIKGRYKLVPEGMLYRIVPESEQIDPEKLARYNERLWSSYKLDGVFNGAIHGTLEMEIPRLYGAMLTSLADTELSAKMYYRAERDFSKALTADPKLQRTRTGLGVALAYQGKYQEAAKEWQTVLAYNPKDETALRGMSVVRRKMGDAGPR